MGSIEANGWRPLSVGVIGGGIGGLSTAIALRRAGHTVTIYERNDFAGEAGASVSCAANGTRWLHEWGVDVEKGDPVVLKKLINRDWTTGEPVSVYDLNDYEERWGYVYNMFHRQYMHKMLMECALQEEGEGTPVELLVNHPVRFMISLLMTVECANDRLQCKSIDLPTGLITFSNNTTAHHDLIIGADGIGSITRKIIGLNPEKRPAESSCLHANVLRKDIQRLGLQDYSLNSALEYWGGQEGKWDKIVLSPCNGGELLSYYCFFPREKGDYANQTWGGADLPVEELLAPYPELDEKVKAHLAIGIEVRPWRLWVHQPYPYVVKGCIALIGDAAHPVRELPSLHDAILEYIETDIRFSDDAAPKSRRLHGNRRRSCPGHPIQQRILQRRCTRVACRLRESQTASRDKSSGFCCESGVQYQRTHWYVS